MPGVLLRRGNVSASRRHRQEYGVEQTSIARRLSWPLSLLAGGYHLLRAERLPLCQGSGSAAAIFVRTEDPAPVGIIAMVTAVMGEHAVPSGSRGCESVMRRRPYGRRRSRPWALGGHHLGRSGILAAIAGATAGAAAAAVVSPRRRVTSPWCRCASATPGPRAPVSPPTSATPAGHSPLSHRRHPAVTVAGAAGVPADATAVVLHVTATGTGAASFLTVWPTGQAQPTAASVNWAAGQTVSNLVQTGVGDRRPGQRVQLRLRRRRGRRPRRATSRPATGALYTPLTPTRVCDTRPGQPANQCNLGGPASGTIGSGQTREVNVGHRLRRPRGSDGGGAQRHRHHHLGGQLPDGLARRGGPAAGIQPQLGARPDRVQPGHNAGQCGRPHRSLQRPRDHRRGRRPGWLLHLRPAAASSRWPRCGSATPAPVGPGVAIQCL